MPGRNVRLAEGVNAGLGAIGGDVSLVGLSGLYIGLRALGTLGAPHCEGACNYTPTFDALSVVELHLSGNTGFKALAFDWFDFGSVCGWCGLPDRDNDGDAKLDTFVSALNSLNRNIGHCR